MKVSVRAFGEIKRALGGHLTVELEDGAKLRDLILKLGGKVRDSRRAFLGGYRLEDSALIVLVNGRNIHALDGIDTVLKEGDFVTFMPVLV
ncbi:MAG: MoaD/ThiS family protein, partial [Candidatus Bathyarchaeia archaeon]